VNYNPWDVGTRREDVDDEEAIGRLVGELGVDGVFLDTMKEARPGLRAAVDAARPGVAFEGESTLALARICDHHLSWAQWFCDSAVPGVLRARWFEQRHMLHHTRRWNRDHVEELHSAWLNGVGMLVWENVFGAWVGWNERDKALLRAMLPVQRDTWSCSRPASGRRSQAASADRRVVASRWADGETTLWAVANRGESRTLGQSASWRSTSRLRGSRPSRLGAGDGRPAAATRASRRARRFACLRRWSASTPCRRLRRGRAARR
jgi:hypothetical protein